MTATVTFVIPGGSKTSGGVYILTQLAACMASYARVNLVTLGRGPDAPPPGVALFSAPGLAAEKIPQADYIVVYADHEHRGEFCSLPAEKGEKVLYLQGMPYGKNAARAWRNLAEARRRGHRVISCSRWLDALVRRERVEGTYVPHGLDHELFNAEGADSSGAPVVSMLTHRSPWKGTEDGLKALSLIGKKRPDVVFWLYGKKPVAFRANFLYEPDRIEVANLMRRTTVFVCPSWEEGFGLPGLEALACGAALATTDTKGSREYAFHERTALVSRPRDPEALAESALRLLDDADLRRRLTGQAQEYIRQTISPWPQASRVFFAALQGEALRRPELPADCAYAPGDAIVTPGDGRLDRWRRALEDWAFRGGRRLFSPASS